ncbi:hypothetical protein Gpo141_00010970 [Globisporangium polare]
MLLSLTSLLSTLAELVLFPVLLTFTTVKTLAQYAGRGFAPLYPKWTLRFEVSRALKRFVTERYGEALSIEPTAGRMRRVTEVAGSFVGWISCRRHRTVIEPEIVNGLEHLWLKSSSQEEEEKKGDRFVVLYYHGGGYAVYSPRYFIDFCNTLRATIVRELGSSSIEGHVEVDFFIANYRKTPVHKFPVPQQDALLAYEYLVEHHKISPSNIIVAGDSAGGGLTMSTLLSLRDAKKQHLMPLAAVVSCGYLDVTEEPKDFVPPPHCGLSQILIRSFRRAALPHPDDQFEARRYSAIHADLRGLPPMLIQAASLDYLYKNSLDLVAKANADGVLKNWEVDLHEGVPHVFMTTSPAVLPYAAVGMQNVAAFVVKHVQSSLEKTIGGKKA